MRDTEIQGGPSLATRGPAKIGHGQTGPRNHHELQPFGDCLDLGWCILKPLSDEVGLRLRKVTTYSRIEATMAAYAGLRRHQFKALSDERKEELRIASLWMTMQFHEPWVGRPFWGGRKPV